MKKKDLIAMAKSLYGKNTITKKMLDNIRFRINRIKAHLNIPTVRLEDCIAKCHISKSNIKTNIPSWSTYPGNDTIYLKDGRKVSDMLGTCKDANCETCKNWDSCYAIRMLRYPNVAKSYIENTLFLREDINGLEKCLVDDIKPLKSNMFRFDVSGEIETFKQFIMFLSVAYQIPNKTFYVYTKNYDILYRYFSTGCELPNNFHVLISIWHESGIKCYNDLKKHENIHCFIYNDGFDYKSYGLELLDSCQCKAYDKNGKLNHNITCIKCQKCWTKKIVWTFPH